MDLWNWSGNTFLDCGIDSSTLKRHLLRDDLHAIGRFDQSNHLLAYAEIVMKQSASNCSLCRVIVRPNARGKGLGKSFCMECALWARNKLGCSVMNLNVLKLNRSAICCYLATGFRITQVVPKARAMGDKFHDLVLMSKKLRH